MSLKRLLVFATAMSLIGTGLAFASHVEQVDPESVPSGFFATHNTIERVGIKAIERATRPDGAEIYVQHLVLTEGAATPWHTHPGPVFVSVVKGSLTLEKVTNAGTCVRKVFEAGTGFFDTGAQTHRAVGGEGGAHFYATYVLPRGSDTHVHAHESAPAECS